MVLYEHIVGRGTFLYTVGIALVFVVIWVPWFAHNHVPELRPSPMIIDEGRRIPGDTLLEELSNNDIGLPLQWTETSQVVEAAEKLLERRIELPGFPIGTFTYPFSAVAMASGPTMWQLFVHSLGLHRVLLEAYKNDGRVEFLRAAAEYLVAYDQFEGSGWSLGGYLWNDQYKRFVQNDHAVAARVYVLAEFWRLYRHSSDYRADVADAVFRMAARCAYLLADPSRFTFATNHGVMQNLAICRLRLSFPTLPGVDDYCRLAFERLNEQLQFFINDEGFVLEHSPGYQAFALELLRIAFKYRSLLGLPIPPSWLARYEAAQNVYALLLRPDGSLPTFGDTDSNSYGAPVFDDQGRIGPEKGRAQVRAGTWFLAPVAGYYLSSDGFADRLSQTAITWSYIRGMGHKHADEMSLAFWARGTSWWANVGYWPYDDLDRSAAESWDGSNAPHLVGEPTESSRGTQLRYSGRRDDLSVIDLERVGPGSYRARRQVISIGQNIWVVVDSSKGVAKGRTRIIWNTTPNVRLIESGAKGAYRLLDGASRRWTHVYIDGSPGTEQRVIKGSRTPFGGWLVVKGTIQSTPGIVVEQPADGSWTTTAWSFGEEPHTEFEITAAPQMNRWAGAEDWEMILPRRDNQIMLRRFQNQVFVTSTTAGRQWSLELEPGPDVAQARSDLRAAFASVAAKYYVADMSGIYRAKVSVLLISLLFLNVMVSFWCRRYRPVWRQHVMFVMAIGWLLVSYYFIFLRAQLL